MGNCESRRLIEFIVSHKMNYEKYETHFAEFSKIKTPHNQNFSDFTERFCSLESIVMENLPPQ